VTLTDERSGHVHPLALIIINLSRSDNINLGGVGDIFSCFPRIPRHPTIELRRELTHNSHSDKRKDLVGDAGIRICSTGARHG